MSIGSDLFGVLHDAQAEAYKLPNRRIALTDGSEVVVGLLFAEVDDLYLLYVGEQIKSFWKAKWQRV